VSTGGNFGFGVIAREGAQLSVTESIIVNPTSSTDFGSMLQAQPGSNGGSLLTVSNSRLDRNGFGDFFSGSDNVVAETNAWFDGSQITSGSDIAAHVAGVNNDFNPYLTSGSDTDSGTPGFQGDLSALTLTTAGDALGSPTDPFADAYDAVTSGGTVTVEPGTYTRSALDVQENTTLASGAAVSVTDVLTLSNGTLDVTQGTLTLPSTSETDAASIAGTGSGSVTGDVTFERYLDKSDDASHFRMLSAPTATLLDDEGAASNADNLLSNVWTQSPNAGATGADVSGSGVNASVFTYDETMNLNDSSPDLARGWQGVRVLNDLSSISGQTAIDPGRGFLVSLFADRDPTDNTTEGFPVTLTATGPVQAEENNGSPITPPLSFTSNDGAPADGWNLIANPFAAPIDWESIENNGGDLTNVDGTVYILKKDDTYATYTADGSGTSGTATNGGARYVAPFQAFFVKATGSSPSLGGIDANDKAVNASPDVKDEGASRPVVALQLRAADDSTGETTVVRYSENASPTKDRYDAYQLQPLAASYGLVASRMSGTNALFDHQNRPIPDGTDRIDLAIDVTDGGTYVLEAGPQQTVPARWRVILENVDTGARYDLTAGDAATLNAEGNASAKTDGGSLAERLRDGRPTVAMANADDALPSFRLHVGPEAALPVELTRFDATAQNGSVALTWRTASETNNAGFTVERTVGDASQSDWTPVGSVEGAGTTDRPQTYRFRDDDVPFAAETVTYRLRQRDVDGTTTRSDPVTVELGAPDRLQLHAPFPNPARQQVTVRYGVPDALSGQRVQIAVFDVLGRRVETVVDASSTAGRAQRTLRTGDLAPGTYFVRMQVGSTVRTERLSIVR
jgi:hypothetical protein